MEDLDYLQRRERQARAAAKHASTPAARAAHQELAQLYAAHFAILLGRSPLLRDA